MHKMTGYLSHMESVNRVQLMVMDRNAVLNKYTVIYIQMATNKG